MVKLNANLLICSLVAFCLFEFVLTIEHELIVIEKNPNGLYVATSEHSYAFTHPDLAECNWSSVSLRDNQVFIVKQDNSSSLRLWDHLDESERDLISDLRSDFIANLAGLRLTHPSRPKYYKKPAKKQMKVSNNNRYELLRSPTNAASSAVSFRYKPLLSHAYIPRRQPQPHPQPQRYQVLHRGPVASVGYSKTGMKGVITSSGHRSKAIEKKVKNKPQAAATKYATPNYHNKVMVATDHDESDERQPSTYGSGISGSSSYGIIKSGSSSSGYGSGSGNGKGKGSGSLSSFNYHNVQQSELKNKLTGDVYHFDMNGNILDVFSSTISIQLEQKLQRKTSILYRDESFFSYASTNLPLAISRLFIKNGFAFFVHRDSTVLAEPIHLLNSKEKILVYKTKAHVKKLSQWQTLPSGYIFSIPKESPANESADNNSTVSSSTDATYQSSGEAIDTITTATTTKEPEQLQSTSAAPTDNSSASAVQ